MEINEMRNYNFYQKILESWTTQLTPEVRELQKLTNDQRIDNQYMTKYERWLEFQSKLERMEKDIAEAKEQVSHILDICAGDEEEVP